MNPDEVLIDDKWILSKRGSKNQISPKFPYHWFIEKERTAKGVVEDVLTIFLSNKECPFKCLMCDLWKNTTDRNSIPGQIPHQISWVLEKYASLPNHIKLYNNGNFFDHAAIPKEDYSAIADLLSSFETVLVENHPKMVNSSTFEFQELLKPQLQVAMGLETSNRDVLKRLNKGMTLDDFSAAAGLLSEGGIKMRAFILLKPPFLDEQEGIIWAKKSIDYALNVGVECCVVIPTRGSDVLGHLSESQYSPPRISSLEEVLEYGLSLDKGRVFGDVWDLKQFSTCGSCFTLRESRINRMNLDQVYTSGAVCAACDE